MHATGDPVPYGKNDLMQLLPILLQVFLLKILLLLRNNNLIVLAPLLIICAQKLVQLIT